MNFNEEMFFQEIAERVKPEFRSLAESVSEHYDITGQLSYKQASWLVRTAEYQGVAIPPSVVDKISRHNLPTGPQQVTVAERGGRHQLSSVTAALSEVSLKLIGLTEAITHLVDTLSEPASTKH